MTKNSQVIQKRYGWAVFLSSLSGFLGFFREILIFHALGFSVLNDTLQIYLSIFYMVLLSGDAVRLSTLNLCERLSLNKIIICISLIMLPLIIIEALILYFMAGNINSLLLTLTIIGGYLNVVAGILIIYRQRYGAFLAAQVIYVMPNIVLIPAVLSIYFLPHNLIIYWLVAACTVVPIVQIICLFFIKVSPVILQEQVTIMSGTMVAARHCVAVLGEQLFQIVVRIMCYRLAPGGLSILAIVIRIHATAKFVLVDSYIGSHLELWDKVKNAKRFSVEAIVSSSTVSAVVMLSSIGLFFLNSHNESQFVVQLALILILGFYFSAVARIAYYRINREVHNSTLVVRYGLYDLLSAGLCYIALLYGSNAIPFVLWFWYIGKLYLQQLFLQTHYKNITFITKNNYVES